MRDKLINRIRRLNEETCLCLTEVFEELSNDKLLDILEDLAVERHIQWETCLEDPKDDSDR